MTSRAAPKFGDVYRWHPNGHLVMVINDSPISFITISEPNEEAFGRNPHPYLCHPSRSSSAPWGNKGWVLVDE